ncbi:MAG: PepSY-associated TM helix domain-containing protein, partial [Pseudomonadota bacterium]
MSVLAQSQSKRLLAIHGWSGVVLGALLYVVILTGAVAVFAHEIGQWSASGARAADPLDRPIDAKLRSLANDIDPKYRDDVVVFANSGGAIVAFFHTHAENPSGQADSLGVRFHIDPVSMEVLERHEGFGSELPRDQEGALEDFITRLHITLHLPSPWGLWATGVLGFAMMMAAVSGVLLHKHLLKDLFVAPRFSSLLLHRRDRHILAGSWGLPFGFLLAFTGTFFSFVGTIGLPVLAVVAFGGDQEQMIETVLGDLNAYDG